MFKRIAILAALAAGTALLTACNATMSASEGTTGATVDVNLATGEEEPVDCGEVDVNGSIHKLIAVQANGGIVGCTEAFNVIDEYLTIPAQERGASLNGTDLSGDWACTTDDGETAAIGCVKDHTGDDYGLAFTTTPV